MASALTFAQLPEEEAAFLSYLEKTGDVWARSDSEDPFNPVHEPLPVRKFLESFGQEIERYNTVCVYLGFKDDIHRPTIYVAEDIEGGVKVPFVQNGKELPGVSTIVGGTKVKRNSICIMGSPYISYRRGQYRTDSELATSNLCYYPGSFVNETWIAQTESFKKWAKNTLSWMRRKTPKLIPVFKANYHIRATAIAAEAHTKGLNVR